MVNLILNTGLDHETGITSIHSMGLDFAISGLYSSGY